MKKNDVCDIYCFDQEKVNRVQEDLQQENITGIAQLFKALADENRAKIVYSLCRTDELCVCDIANIIGSSVATASHHIRTLHKQGVVNYRKAGKMAFYFLEDEHIKQLLMFASAHKKAVDLNV